MLIFVDGAIPTRDGGGARSRPPAVDSRGVPRLGSAASASPDGAGAEEVRRGRRHVLTIGSSTSLGYHFGLPIRNALVERSSRTMPRCRCRGEKFYVPGSILEARVDNTHPLAYGIDDARRMSSSTTARRSACCRKPASKGVKAVAWIDSPSAASERLGVGTAVSRPGRRDRRRAGRQGPSSCCSARRSPGARSRTARSSFLFNGIYYGAAH